MGNGDGNGAVVGVPALVGAGVSVTFSLIDFLMTSEGKGLKLSVPEAGADPGGIPGGRLPVGGLPAGGLAGGDWIWVGVGDVFGVTSVVAVVVGVGVTVGVGVAVALAVGVGVTVPFGMGVAVLACTSILTAGNSKYCWPVVRGSSMSE